MHDKYNPNLSTTIIMVQAEMVILLKTKVDLWYLISQDKLWNQDLNLSWEAINAQIKKHLEMQICRLKWKIYLPIDLPNLQDNTVEVRKFMIILTFQSRISKQNQITLFQVKILSLTRKQFKKELDWEKIKVLLIENCLNPNLALWEMIELFHSTWTFHSLKASLKKEEIQLFRPHKTIQIIQWVEIEI